MARSSTRLRLGDVAAGVRLAADATVGVTNVVEGVHRAVSRTVRLRKVTPGRAEGVAGWVYGAIRAVTGQVARVSDAALARFAASVGATSGRTRDAWVAALNGVLGDHLEASGNALAIAMQCRTRGRPVLPQKVRDPSRRLLVMVHGLCMDDRGWSRAGRNHGTALARELGMSAVFLRYNSGRAIAANGREFSARLEALVQAWPVPVESIAIVAHSMGGLVTRSACLHAEHAHAAWRTRLTHAMFLGTPHHGAALERGGHALDRLLQALALTAPFARLLRVRSRGIQDLRHGNLRDTPPAPHDAQAAHVPLPGGVACHAFGGSLHAQAGPADGLFGDGLVSLESAHGVHRDPARTLAFAPGHAWTGRGIDHMALLHSPAVYRALRQRLSTR